MIFPPKRFSHKPYLTTIFAAGLIAVIAAVEALRLGWGWIDFALLLVALIFLGVFVYLGLNYCRAATLRYRVTRDGVLIEDCLGVTTIPIGKIKEVVSGWEPAQRVGKHWLGLRSSRAGSGRYVQLHATRSPDGQLLVVTSGKFDYGISPDEDAAFMSALEKVRQMGAIRLLNEGYAPAVWRSKLPFGDPYFWAFGVSGGIWLVVLAFVDLLGVSVSERTLLWAAVIWACNLVAGSWLLTRDRTVARLLWLGGLIAAFIAGI
jgi:hypothetical protein